MGLAYFMRRWKVRGMRSAFGNQWTWIGMVGIVGLGIAAVSSAVWADGTSAPLAKPTNAESTPTATPYPASSYGVCSHIGGGEEYQQIPKNLERMREAGIRWVRADFSWSGVEGPQGNWHFDHLDRAVDEALASGVTILPILDYDVAWARPAWKNLDAWRDYVTRTVTRYKDRLRYWEVWNEPNLKGFWQDDPSGANYAILLKETYKIIKEIDPELVVVYGGLAGVPMGYFEDSLKAGAGEAFDVMNIHPYRGGMMSMPLTNQFVNELCEVKSLMAKYGVGDKPLWITEIGWATPPTFGEADHRLVSGAMRVLWPDGMKGTCAVLVDDRYEPSSYYSVDTMRKMLPPETPVEAVTLDQLDGIDPQKYAALLLPPGEKFPTPYFDSLENYVKHGGTLFLMGGVPLYYEMQWDGEGAQRKLSKQSNASDAFRDRLRIGWQAWWTVKGVPETTAVRVANDELVQRAFAGYMPVMPGTRFLTDAKLQAGDRMIPLLLGEGKETAAGGHEGRNFSAPCAVIYDFGSDFTGNLVVSTVQGDYLGQNISTVEDQAVFLPQAILTAFAGGVEKYFWYEFQAMERDDVDKEHHFGIVHQDLTPKPAWQAYQTLTRAFPEGSQMDDSMKPTDIPQIWNRLDFCIVGGKRPDGQKVAALWVPSGTKTAMVTGSVNGAFDYLGKPLSAGKNPSYTLSAQMIYILTTDENLSIDVHD
ncbi:MAG: beta-galactosidase [Thermoguttaceae bacterium]|nr:beta-galactosidase [Thermoguttaceae bacterium]